jgi:hypothetical protein
MVGVDALGMTDAPQRLQPADVGADERLGIAADAIYRGSGALQMSRRTIDAFPISHVHDVSIGRAGAGWSRANGQDHAATDLLGAGSVHLNVMDAPVHAVDHEPHAVPSHRRIDEALEEARKQVRRIVASHDEKDHGDILNRWLNFMETKALAVLLRVPNDADAYRMFETLNDRGLRTSQSDLVKNFLFGRASDRLPEVQQKWALMRGALETIEDEDITITFLRHALTVVHGFVRETQVYDVVQNIAKAREPAVAFAGQLEVLANSYVAIYNPEHEKWNRYSDATRKAIDVLNLFDIKPARPLMLAIAQNLPDKEAEKAFKFCVLVGAADDCQQHSHGHR